MAFRFETLDAARHNREGFRSTVEALNNYLSHQARKDAERRLAATFVMVSEDAPSEIIVRSYIPGSEAMLKNSLS